MQMAGMLVGGIAWGVLGDRRGRLSVLFGSIVLYSIANIANAFVHDVSTYAALRFIAGVGLAGELGAGITLVSEILPKEIRGYGTTIVASVGVMGAVVAVLVGDAFDWRIAYIVGGVMGLALLVLRIGVFESGLFEGVKQTTVARGNFFALFAKPARTRRYLSAVLVGLPIWYVIGILITFAPELGAAVGVTPAPRAARAVLFAYLGLTAGDLASGLLSQWMRSRKRALGLFLGMTLACILVYFAPFAKSLGALLRDLLRAGLVHRLLGDVRDGRLGAVRHQPARDGDDDRAQLRARRGGAGDAAVPGAARAAGAVAGRPHRRPADGDDCRRGAVGAGRDLRSRPRLRRGLDSGAIADCRLTIEASDAPSAGYIRAPLICNLQSSIASSQSSVG